MQNRADYINFEEVLYKMQEKTLYKVSLLMILTGLAILFIYADGLDLKAVERIETAAASEPVKISGTITKVTTQDKAIFLELEGQRTERTNIIIFNDEELFLQEGESVEIYGTAEEYNGNKEIIASKIVKR